MMPDHATFSTGGYSTEAGIMEMLTRMTAWTHRQSAGKAAQKIVPPRPRIPCWKGLSADSEEKREPVSDINAGVVDSLKALDPERPIREAVICEDRSATSGAPTSKLLTEAR
jgi:hypothetical protein